MIWYGSAVTIMLILCYFCTKTYKLDNGLEAKCFPNWAKAFLVLLPLTFLAVFRWDVGADSLYGSSYWASYQDAKLGENTRDFEFGFFALMRLFASLDIPFYWYLFALALLFMILVSVAMSKGSVWTTWSVLVFFLLSFYFDCYSSLRQSLAEAICLLGWAQMGYEPPSHKKDLKILAIFVVAGFFHKIAWMCIPLYLVSKIRFSRKGLLKFLIIVVALSPVIQVVMRFFMQLLADDAYEFVGLARINAIMTGVIAVACWYFYDEIRHIDENAYMYVNQAIYIFVLILNSGAMYLPFRVFDLLKIGYVFIVPYLLRGIKNGRIRMIAQIVLLVIFGAWLYNQLFIQDYFAAHYQTVFSDWERIIHLP